MGLGRKVGAFLGLVPDDQQGDEGSYDAGFDRADGADYGTDASVDHGGYRSYGSEGATAAEPYRRSADHGAAYRGEPVRGGYHPYSSEPMTQGALAVKPEPMIRREPDSVSAARPATVKLTGFSEARIIGEKYRDGTSVILDMTDMSDSDARRLVDFSAGLAFSLRGSIEKVAPKVFMLLPPNVDPSSAGLLADARAFASR